MVRNLITQDGTTRDGDGSGNPRAAVANILSKLAIYFLSFGLVLLLLGGVRSLLMPSNEATRVLVYLGLVTSALGILYTFIVVALVKCLQREHDANLESGDVDQIPPRRTRRHGNSSNVSSVMSATGGYVNGALYGDDGKWEAPPTYEDAMRSPAVSLAIDLGQQFEALPSLPSTSAVTDSSSPSSSSQVQGTTGIIATVEEAMAIGGASSSASEISPATLACTSLTSTRN